MKLFNSLVKPVLLYCSEVWGGYGLKNSGVVGESLYEKLINDDKSVYEQLHIKQCKYSLRVSRRVSNFSARAELGSAPVAHSITVHSRF